MPAFPYTADYLAGYAVTSSVLAALYNAQKTGSGESIDVAMYEVLLNAGQYYMMNHFNGGRMCPRQTKGKDPIWAGCGTYSCLDGFIVMEVVGAYQVEQMLEKIALGHLWGTEDIPAGTQLVPRENPMGALFEDKLDEFLGALTVKEALAALGAIKIAGSKVLTVEELEDNPQYVARKSLIEWESLSGRKIKGPNVTPRFKNNPCKVWRPMPSRGLDTSAILTELGYSENEITSLADRGVVSLGEASKTN